MTRERPVLGGLKAVFLDQRPALSRMLTARLGSREEAEDALQDIWMKLDSVPAGPISQPVSYLYRMASNHATDVRISQTRGVARDTAWQSLQSTEDEIPDLEQILISRERLRQVEAVIAVMPDRMRDALRMFRLEGVSQRDIAARLSISVSGVEKLLQRCYRILIEADGNPSEDIVGQRRLTDGGPK